MEYTEIDHIEEPKKWWIIPIIIILLTVPGYFFARYIVFKDNYDMFNSELLNIIIVAFSGAIIIFFTTVFTFLVVLMIFTIMTFVFEGLKKLFR